MNFSELNLNENILKAVSEQGFKKASDIQAKAIPPILEGRDVLAAAQTGTGKTAGFGLPILQLLSLGSRARNNQVRALILCPTRELAAQVSNSIEQFGAYMNITTSVVYGGVKINPQMMRLRKGSDILVATPGRLLDLYNQNALKFDRLEILVFDEADRMLDMGFIHDIKKILAILPKRKQSLLFSATFSKEIRSLGKSLVQNPVEISVSPQNSTANTVSQCLIPVDKKKKSKLLIQLIKERQWQQVLVFARTKHGANRLCRELNESGISSAAIHGNKSQAARMRALAEFKALEIRILVATDIAARGLDIDQLPQVVNFDLPNVPEDYVHRIGRTGRAGATGEAISLVAADEHKQLIDIERVIGKLIEREYEPGFEPVHELPESTSNFKPKKIKKPKKHRAPSQRNDDQNATGKKTDKPNTHRRRQPKTAQKQSHNLEGKRQRIR